MFTGLVQRVGKLAAVRRSAGGRVVDVLVDGPWEGGPLVRGESVAVQGCCLTVTDIREDGFSADVLEETYAVTALGRLAVGAKMNLERALRPVDRMGGHIVQGHVDGLATLLAKTPAGRDWCLRFRAPADEARYLVRKGSVALDGVSLTVSAMPAADEFEVCLIPTTLAETSLGERVVGDVVNLETDVLGRYVERMLVAMSPSAPAPKKSEITLEKLAAAGFLG